MQGKYIFVSGAAGGIGKETISYLVNNGFHVFAGDKNPEVINIFSRPNVTPILLDITNENSIEQARRTIASITDKLSGLVNIAGIFDQFPLMEVSHDAFEKLINTNLVGHQVMTRTFFPLLYKGKGRVINLSSEMVLAQLPLQAYGFSKKLFDIWSTQLRMELNLLDMRVVTIRAGGHMTPFIEESSKIIGEIDRQSKYMNLMERIKAQGQKMLRKPKADPIDVAKTIYKALTRNKPKKVYNVNVSFLFIAFSLIPVGIRERLISYQLKKWM